LTTEILFLGVLILLNAFFSSAEIALISLNDNKIKKMSEEGDKKAKLVEKLLSEPSKFFATIQIGITLVGFFASAYAAESFADGFVNALKGFGLAIPEDILKTFSITIITIILAYFTLVFGELVPKRIGMQKAEKISFFAVEILNFLGYITSPFVKFLTISTNLFLRLTGNSVIDNDKIITEEEIRMMIDIGEEKGTIRFDEKEMINNIFEFDKTEVCEIMTHRTEIVGIPVTSKINDVLDIINKEKFTRIPVYEESIDNIIGIFHTKDLLKFMNNNIESFDLKQLLRKPCFIPQSKKTDELLKELRVNKNHMAVIIDEYGGTAGIVTMEDLIEEIVGNIFDEYDEEKKLIEKIDENTFVFDGIASLDVVGETMGVEMPVDDYDTLSGFLMGQLGRIPDEKEKLTIEYANIVFKIEKIEDKKILKVKACKS